MIEKKRYRYDAVDRLIEVTEGDENVIAPDQRVVIPTFDQMIAP